MKLGQFETDFAPTLFHLAIVVLCSIVYFSWFHWTPCVCMCIHCCKCCVCKCCSCCKYVACFSVIMLLLTHWILLPSWASPDMAMTFFFLFFQSLLPLYLSKLTTRCGSLCQRGFCRCILCLSMFLSFVITETLLDVSSNIYLDGADYYLGFCSLIGGISWFNPLFFFSSLRCSFPF